MHAPGFGGIIGAVLFFCLTQSPSMLPRTWLLQGVVSGITAAFGYGIGASIGAAARALGPASWRRRQSRGAWWTLIGLSTVLIIVFLLLGRGWQNEVRALMGMTDPLVWDVTLIFVVGVAVAGALVLLARVIRLGSRRLGRALDRFIPRRIAYLAGAVVVALVVAGLVQGVLWDGFISVMNKASSLANGGTAPGIVQPTDPARSGSPQSLAAWSTLGVEGRTFVASGPDQATLTTFNGTPAKDPIRVYAGLDSADSLQGEVDLAMAELDRTGAWNRSVLTVVTTTGTGWVDPAAATSMEYVWNGDTAQVALQYSYLPSWVSFLVDRSKAADAAAALIDAVRGRWLTLPADARPKLFVFGESLGAFGTDAVFDNVQQVVTETDGALLAGPPFADALHQRITAERDPTSPVWLPIVDQGRAGAVRRRAGRPGQPADGMVDTADGVLQNSSDPVVWWGPDLMLHRPEWLESPRGPGHLAVHALDPGGHVLAGRGGPGVRPGRPVRPRPPVRPGLRRRLGRARRPADWTQADTQALRAIIDQQGDRGGAPQRMRRTGRAVHPPSRMAASGR